MKSRTVLKSMGFFAIGLSVVIGLVLLRAVMASDQAEAERQAAQNVIIGAFDLNLLTHDYVLHPGERAELQWRVRYDELRSQIQEFPPQDSNGIGPFTGISRNLAEIGTVFDRLVASITDSPPAAPGGLNELQNALAGRLMINLQTVMSAATSVFQENTVRVDNIRNWTHTLVLVSVLAATIMLIIGTIFLDRLLSRPTMALHEGTKRIAAGDLSHRVRPTGFAEHKELAVSFNAMGSKLQGSYARLKDEIGMRMKTQQELSRTLDQLEERVRERTMDLQSANAALQGEMELRKRKEEEIREERNRFYALLNNLPAYIFLMDRDYGIRFANRLFVERFGEPDGRPCHEIIQCSKEPCTVCDVRSVFDTGKEQSREFVSPDGRSYQVFDYPFHDRDGTPLVLELGFDITDRKKAEEALIRRELEYRALVENAPDVISRFDSDYKYVYVNPAVERITGHPPSVFIGKRVSEVGFSAELSKLFEKNIDLVLSTGQIHVFEHDYPAEDDLKHLYMILAPEPDPKGGTGTVLTITRDVTSMKRLEYALRRSHEELETRVEERTAELAKTVGALEREVAVRSRTELALREREQQYKALVENAPDIIARVDREHRVLYINPVVEKLTSKTRDWFIGRKIEEMESPHKGAFITSLEEVFRTGRERVMETEYRFGGEGPWFFLTRLTPELSKEGKVETVLSISHDITHLKRLERELREVSQAKSDFLANMSHELRTPISGILGIIEMDMQRELPSEIRDDLQMIRSSASALINIINDLLDLSRIEARKLRLTPMDFDLRRKMLEVIRSYKPQAFSRGLALDLVIAPGVPQIVHGDPDRLAQVLKNLVGNALKFTERGGVTVTVDNASGEPDALADKLMLAFTVADTGIGIPPERQKDLFQSFSQLEPTLSKKHGGAGLGLVISKQIVEMMGGSIGLTSTPGKGTVLSFTALFEQPVGERRSGIRKQGAQMISEFRPLRILLAEDNQVNRVFMTRFLTNAGHTVVPAENGKEVMELLPREHFDLILMDIQMPEMDGLETTRLIRSSDGETFDRDVPIIALTAYAMKGDKERFLEAGMNDYVTKPVNFEHLARSIATALRKEEAHPA
jgi:PAS domain S-box-containing protein